MSRRRRPRPRASPTGSEESDAAARRVRPEEHPHAERHREEEAREHAERGRLALDLRHSPSRAGASPSTRGSALRRERLELRSIFASSLSQSRGHAVSDPSASRELVALDLLVEVRARHVEAAPSPTRSSRCSRSLASRNARSAACLNSSNVSHVEQRTDARLAAARARPERDARTSASVMPGPAPGSAAARRCSAARARSPASRAAASRSTASATDRARRHALARRRARARSARRAAGCPRAARAAAARAIGTTLSR